MAKRYGIDIIRKPEHYDLHAVEFLEQILIPALSRLLGEIGWTPIHRTDGQIHRLDIVQNTPDDGSHSP